MLILKQWLSMWAIIVRQQYFHYNCRYPYYIYLFAEFQEKYMVLT